MITFNQHNQLICPRCNTKLVLTHTEGDGKKPGLLSWGCHDCGYWLDELIDTQSDQILAWVDEFSEGSASGLYE